MITILLKLPSLLFFCFLFILSPNNSFAMQRDDTLNRESSDKYYNLKEGILCYFPESQKKDISYTKYAYMADENFPFPEGFLKQTQIMIERESVFRNKCNIAHGTNIAQLCLYGIYSDGHEVISTEFLDPRSCKGRFHLSGNDPISLPLTQDNRNNTSTRIDVQKISHGNGYIDVRQRLQPHLESIRYTLDSLIDIDVFITNPTEESKQLALQALNKKQEISTLIDQRDQIIRQLTQEVNSFASLSSQEPSQALKLDTHTFIGGILKELLTCLETNDFNFWGMKGAANNKNFQDYIQQIQRNLSKRGLDQLFNSKYFNLGCSEPLLLFDLLDDPLSQTMLINMIKKNLLTKNLNKIIVQLHSTKTPCRSCLIGCCGHFHKENGAIKAFISNIKASLLKPSLSDSKKDVQVDFLISYHAPYEDSYSFYTPVTSDFVPDSLLLVNMEFYDEQKKKMKERIIKEQSSMLKNSLLEQLQKNGGTLKEEDIYSLM